LALALPTNIRQKWNGQTETVTKSLAYDNMEFTKAKRYFIEQDSGRKSLTGANAVAYFVTP
jgi:hypothetical protein